MAGNPDEGEGRLCTVDLLVLTHFYIEKIINLCCITSYLNEEVTNTEPSPSVSIPWSWSLHKLKKYLNYY
jgi:hypothetical protein